MTEHAVSFGDSFVRDLKKLIIKKSGNIKLHFRGFPGKSWNYCIESSYILDDVLAHDPDYGVQLGNLHESADRPHLKKQKLFFEGNFLILFLGYKFRIPS